MNTLKAFVGQKVYTRLLNNNNCIFKLFLKTASKTTWLI